jgi:hypothetical protein
VIFESYVDPKIEENSRKQHYKPHELPSPKKPERDVVGRAGFEPATFRLSVERSSRAELPARALQRTKSNALLVNKNLVNSTVKETVYREKPIAISSISARSALFLKLTRIGSE